VLDRLGACLRSTAPSCTWSPTGTRSRTRRSSHRPT